MTILRRLAIFFALLLLGALAVRLGLLPVAGAMAGVLGLNVLAFLPWRGAWRALAAVLGLGSAAWLGMMALRIHERLDLGRPWLRLALILGTVAAFTAWTAWLAWRTEAATRSGTDA